MNLEYVYIFRAIFFVKVILVFVVIGLSLIHVFVSSDNANKTDQFVINMRIGKIFTMS